MASSRVPRSSVKVRLSLAHPQRALEPEEEEEEEALAARASFMRTLAGRRRAATR